ATAPDKKWGADISPASPRHLLCVDPRRLALPRRRYRPVRTPGRWRGNRRPAASRPGSCRSAQRPDHALSGSRAAAGLIHHSDRGSQYCSIDYPAELNKHGILVSMSGKGNCYDNAMVETFFKTLKSELVWRTVFDTRHEADLAIGRYIDGFYNPVRRHSALDFTSPAQFEKHAAK